MMLRMYLQVTAHYHADIIELSQPSPSVLWDWDFHFNPFEGLDYLTLKRLLVLNTEQIQNQDLPGVC